MQTVHLQEKKTHFFSLWQSDKTKKRLFVYLEYEEQSTLCEMKKNEKFHINYIITLQLLNCNGYTHVWPLKLLTQSNSK